MNPPGAPKPGNEASPLIGVWQMVRAELAGEPAPELVVHKTEIEWDRETYTVRFAGEIADRGTYTLGSVATAQTLMLTGVEGPNAGRTIPCIYQLVGDRLRVCYGLDGISPATFMTAAAQPHYLATYRRK